MNAKQVAKATMYQKVSLCFAKFLSLFITVEPLKDTIDAFTPENDKLQPLVQQQQQGSNGTTKSKEALKQSAIKQVMTLIKKARPWAKKVANKELIEQWAVNNSDFRIDELQAAALLAALVQSINDNKANLTIYKIADTDITNATAAVNAFSNAIGTPSQQQAVVKIATGNIPTLILNIDDILNDADDLIEGNFGDSHPDAVKEYHEARHIGSSIGQHTAIIAHIYADADHLQPIVGAVIGIDAIQRSDDTDADGMATIIQFKAGTYTLKITAAGYADKTIQFTVKSGKHISVDVVLDKV